MRKIPGSNRFRCNGICKFVIIVMAVIIVLVVYTNVMPNV